MMPGDRDLSNDDYVAKLLAQDAKKSSQRYAAVGLAALLPQRATKSAPKPNTRFLSHIVREADSHNAALKKKEELEARIRLREMKERDKRGREDRQDGRERKRQRVSNGDEDKTRCRRRRSRDRDTSLSPRRRRAHSPRGSRSRDTRRKDDKEKRRASPQREYSDDSHDKKHRKSARRPRLHSDDRDQKREREHKRNRDLSPTTSPMSESDPLEDIVGSFPPTSRRKSAQAPVHVRGRGVQAPSGSKSNIDAHFSPTYDPSLDVQPDSELMSEQEDWDMALEALRDRAMWKKKQSDRLREAGFGDEDIRKWEKSAIGPTSDAGHGDLRNVRWAKKGEKRAWDIGKKEPSDLNF